MHATFYYEEQKHVICIQVLSNTALFASLCRSYLRPHVCIDVSEIVYTLCMKSDRMNEGQNVSTQVLRVCRSTSSTDV